MINQFENRQVESWIHGQYDIAALHGAAEEGGNLRRRTYAVVDASREPMMIPAALNGFATRVSCLYSGAALQEFGDNAAWVVELDPTESTLKWLLDQGFNKRWAIFANSTLDLPSFVRHLKKFTVANDSSGRTFFFRFYDPDVLRQYLPMFDERQMNSFFRSIDDVFFEDTSGQHVLIKYSLSDDGSLQKTAVI